MALLEHGKLQLSDRRQMFVFDGVTEISDGITEERGWRMRIKITMAHDKDRKLFTATIRRCTARLLDDGSTTIERTTMFQDPWHTILTEPVARFSEGKFSAFCIAAQLLCEEMAADTTDNPTVGHLLLREAASYVYADRILKTV